ncbi:MAG: hypothetical protein H0W39_06750 [Sphingomonas sp.]|nr:hypothetical protein [Sphingomonas sp.]
MTKTASKKRPARELVVANIVSGDKGGHWLVVDLKGKSVHSTHASRADADAIAAPVVPDAT